MAHITAIIGSPSAASRTAATVEPALTLLRRASLTAEVVLVRDLDPTALIHARFDDPGVQAAIAAVDAADGVIIATPVYKASYSGVLKTFLDLLPRDALAGKPVLPVVTGGTIAHLLALDYALKPVLAALGTRHLLGGVFVEDTRITRLEDDLFQLDEETERRLATATAELVAAVDLRLRAAQKEAAVLSR